MKRIFYFSFTLIFSFVNVLLFAQNEGDKKDPTGWSKADKMYQEKGYMASANKYQMKQSAKEMKPEVMAKIANSYRLNGETDLAEYWFAQCIHQTNNVEDKLHYAEVLQSTGKCEDAIRWYKEYEKETGTNRKFIEDCAELKNFKEHENVEVENLKKLNTPYLDYSAMTHDDGVIFTSTRGVLRMSKVTDTWTKSNFSDVFFAKKNEEGKFERPEPIEGAINKKYHDGVTTISKTGTVMFFSRNNSKGKRKDGVIDLKIYTSIFVDGAWKDAKELKAINGNNFASCHPTLSADGKLLYFASNRPGGFGGMDIYVSENVDGKWEEPQNLGPTVNSAGNELFPFVTEEGTLFFASNGHKGLGGLDVFYAEKASMFDEATWTIRKNIGKPFNTKKDDFGFFANVEMTEGYMTSNRFGGLGGDDIYTWKSTDGTPLKFNEAMMANFKVVASEDQSEIRNAQITVESIAGQGGMKEGKTNVKGLLETSVRSGQTYQITVEKEGYLTQEKEMTAADLLEMSVVTFDLEKVKCIELFGTVLNDKYKKVIPNVEVILLNKCTGEKTVVRTQEDGSFDFCLDRDCDFEIVASKEHFMATETMFSTINNTSDMAAKEIKIEMLPKEKMVVETTPTPVVKSNPEVKDTPIVKNTPVVKSKPIVKSTPVVKTETTSTPNTQSTMVVKKHFLGNENSTFYDGQVLTLVNSYYGFNKFDLTSDAQTDLNLVITMLHEFPNMEITLNSYTDSRGEKEYNKKLSETRAQLARDYLISKGIAANRVLAEGQGESLIKNDCIDGVECTEKEHQVNRRTEVVIRKVK